MLQCNPNSLFIGASFQAYVSTMYLPILCAQLFTTTTKSLNMLASISFLLFII